MTTMTTMMDAEEEHFLGIALLAQCSQRVAAWRHRHSPRISDEWRLDSCRFQLVLAPADGSFSSLFCLDCPLQPRVMPCRPSIKTPQKVRSLAIVAVLVIVPDEQVGVSQKLFWAGTNKNEGATNNVFGETLDAGLCLHQV